MRLYCYMLTSIGLVLWMVVTVECLLRLAGLLAGNLFICAGLSGMCHLYIL